MYQAMSSFSRRVIWSVAVSLSLLYSAFPAFTADDSMHCKMGAEASSGTIESICQNKAGVMVANAKSIVERLKPGVDFQGELKRIAAEHNLKAGVIVSAVGSFRTASLRFAGANEATTITGPLEVVSVTGTISEKGMHVHLSVSDANGKTIGGHLMPGCKVFTTIELVIVDLSDDWSFERKTDEHTTYLELDPQPIDAK